MLMIATAAVAGALLPGARLLDRPPAAFTACCWTSLPASHAHRQPDEDPPAPGSARRPGLQGVAGTRGRQDADRCLHLVLEVLDGGLGWSSAPTALEFVVNGVASSTTGRCTATCSVANTRSRATALMPVPAVTSFSTRQDRPPPGSCSGSPETLYLGAVIGNTGAGTGEALAELGKALGQTHAAGSEPPDRVATA